MDFLRFFLILIVPGIMGAILYSLITNCRLTGVRLISSTLTFDLWAFLTMITGIYFFYDNVKTMSALIFAFDCLSFTRKYALLTILFVLIYATIAALIRRFLFWWRRCE